MKLTTTQENILNAASNRSSGNIEPLPNNINAGIKPRVINGLLTRQLIEQSGDTYIISPAGYTAIGKQPIAEKPPHRKGTKQAAMIEMMRHPDGASIEEICSQTGWQKHTVIGAPCYLTKFRDSCRRNSVTYAANRRCSSRPASATD